MAGRGGVAAMLCALALAGCASLTEGSTQTVAVTTTPKAGANCTLQNDKGSWYIPSTPASTLIVKAYGPLNVTCKTADGEEGMTSVASHTALATFGNAIIGGVIGVAADMSSGAAYFYPPEVTVALASDSPAKTDGTATAPPATPAASASAPVAAAPPAAPTPISAAAPVSPDALHQATEYCSKIDQDARLDPLRDVIALDKPPSLAMQTSTAHLTAEQKRALDAWQPLYTACRDKLMATSPEIARLFAKDGVRNRDFLSLYQGKTTIGDFNRARARDFENVRIAVAELAPPPAAAAAPATVEPAVAYAAPGQPPGPETRPVDYCQGMNELVCVDHQHHI
jgi:hypothetical protein